MPLLTCKVFYTQSSLPPAPCPTSVGLVQGLRELEKAAGLVKKHLSPESQMSQRWYSCWKGSTQQSSAGIPAPRLPAAWPPGAHTTQARSGYLGRGSRQGRSPHREHLFHAPPFTLGIVSAQECLGEEGSWVCQQVGARQGCIWLGCRAGNGGVERSCTENPNQNQAFVTAGPRGAHPIIKD